MKRRHIKDSTEAIEFLLIIIVVNVFAQTGIGTTTLNASKRL